jgi:hypothetical protein
VHAAGPVDMNESGIFWQIAQYLSEREKAVLVQPEVDTNRISIISHSEGDAIATRVASNNQD